MPAKEQAIRADQDSSPKSLGQSRDQAREPTKFIFDVALSTAIAANGERQATVPAPKGPLTPDMLDKMNRLIKEHDANFIYIAGPGHGGPSLNAMSYLEGTYTEVHPEITPDENGLRLMFRKFSTPGGVPSHCGPHVPNSMHEGGELGYSLVHAFGAAFDNPDLIVACVIGDGESETCPLEGSWKSVNFLNPVRDGAVLPILHLNGY